MIKTLKNTKNILVAYGSRYGCTESIAHNIIKLLNSKEELHVKISNLTGTKASDWPLIANYDGVLIGSGIRLGMWTKETKRFLLECKKQINNNKPILGVFVSCGYAADPKYYPEAIKLFLERVMQKAGIKPDLYDAFGGVFDYSKQTKKNYINRKILNWGARDLNLNVKYDSINDFRDWKKIEDFTEEFVSLLINN